MNQGSKTSKENLEKLFRLMQENPELPVLPMVNSEIICETYCTYWSGSFGDVVLTAYVIGDERIYFREDDSDEMETVLNNVVGGQDWYDVAEDDVKQAYHDLPWTEAIVVYIEYPYE